MGALLAALGAARPLVARQVDAVFQQQRAAWHPRLAEGPLHVGHTRGALLPPLLKGAPPLSAPRQALHPLPRNVHPHDVPLRAVQRQPLLEAAAVHGAQVGRPRAPLHLLLHQGEGARPRQVEPLLQEVAAKLRWHLRLPENLQGNLQGSAQGLERSPAPAPLLQRRKPRLPEGPVLP